MNVILAECNGNFWVVAGEDHVGALLSDTLPPDIGVEFVTCASWNDMMALWGQHTEGSIEGRQPWVINPAIIRRIKGSLDGRSVSFAPWSAALTAEAEETIKGAGEWLQGKPGARLRVRQSLPTAPEPGMEDLQRLRQMLVMAALQREGVEADRLAAETGISDDANDTDRVRLLEEEVFA